jgi:hypothetical protein
MKKLFILSCSFSAVISQAQITLNQSDFGSPGDVFYQAVDGSAGELNLGTASSTTQNWNFTTLTIDQLDTLNFVNPANAPGGIDFPNASVALLTGPNTALFFNNTPNAVQVLGNGAGAGGFGFSAPFNPPFNLLTYPTTYGANSSQNYSFDITNYIGLDTTADVPIVGTLVVQLDSIRIKRDAQVNINFDAFGNLTLPIGTFNSLRALNVQTNNDSTFAYLLQPVSIPLFNINLTTGWNIITNDIAAAISVVAPGIFVGNTTGITVEKSYDWFTNNKDYLLCTVRVDSATATIPQSARYLSDPIFLSNPEADLIEGAYAYPNPTNQFMAINGLPTGFSGQVILTDMGGRTVMRSSFFAETPISLEHLPTGLFNVTVISQEGKVMFRDKIQKVK